MASYPQRGGFGDDFLNPHIHAASEISRILRVAVDTTEGAPRQPDKHRRLARIHPSSCRETKTSSTRTALTHPRYKNPLTAARLRDSVSVGVGKRGSVYLPLDRHIVITGPTRSGNFQRTPLCKIREMGVRCGTL